MLIPVVLLINFSYGISIRNIATASNESIDPDIVEHIRQHEKIVFDPEMARLNPNLRDSTAILFRQLYKELRCQEHGRPYLKGDLISGLIMLYLGELGSHSSFDTVKKILIEPAKEFPDNRIIPWLKGLSLIKAGEITNGIKLLDSLRMSGFNEEAFLGDYAGYVFHALTPEISDTQSLILKSFSYAFPDTVSPNSFDWKVTQSICPSQNTKLPCFTYGATFEIRKPFHLVFTGLKQLNLSTLNIGYVPNQIATNSMNYQCAVRKELAFCKLFIDLNDSRSSQTEYLCKRINGRYDSIAIKPEFPGHNGISLRCYNMPWSIYDDGTFTAIATFDREVPDFSLHHETKTNTNKPVTTCRYTLVMQSSNDVEMPSEAKFQRIIRAFF
jgi:hypothetical protein